MYMYIVHLYVPVPVLFMHTHTVVGTIQNLYCDAYHDGIRIFWDGHILADNEGISYHLQVMAGDSDYIMLYRGGETKYTWKTELEKGVVYKFRVQVRTTEGIGMWSEPVTAFKAEPGEPRCEWEWEVQCN